MKKYIISVIMVILIVLLLFGTYYIYSSNAYQTDTNNLIAKADKEIIYLGNTIITLLNEFNNISYANYTIVEEKVSVEDKNENQKNGGDKEAEQGKSSESSKEESQNSSTSSTTNIDLKDNSILVNNDNKVDWNKIKKETENMYSTWTTILIDLNSLNVNKDNLLKYSTILDDVTGALQKKEKDVTMLKLADLYALLSGYLKDYSNDNKLIHVFETKQNVLYSYAFAEQDNKWDDMKKYINQAQSSYINILNSQVQSGQKNNSINKAYILLNEIGTSIDKKSNDIFYINYKNLMQELNVIEKQ